MDVFTYIFVLSGRYKNGTVILFPSNFYNIETHISNSSLDGAYIFHALEYYRVYFPVALP